MWTPLQDTPEEGVEESPSLMVTVTTAVSPTVRANLKPREWMLLGHLYEGNTLRGAATILSIPYDAAKTIAKKPQFKKAIQQIDQAIAERISRGEFGAMAIAKAGAPRAMQVIHDLLDSRHEKTRLQAANDLLKWSGMQPPKPQVTESVERLIDLMTADELEVFASTGEWPERFKDQLARLATTQLKKDPGIMVEVMEEQIPHHREVKPERRREVPVEEE